MKDLVKTKIVFLKDPSLLFSSEKLGDVCLQMYLTTEEVAVQTWVFKFW